jgi:dienelactone hydrolase
MRLKIVSIMLFLLVTAAWFSHNCLMAQTNAPTWSRWLNRATLAPEFIVPHNLHAWEKKRAQIRKELWQLLGDLPARPKLPPVRIISREERQDYILEKFEFDNHAGDIVPGYLLLPRNVSGKVPAVLYCHWHGGEYDIGKEELFQSKHTPAEPGPALVRRGYAVLAIDACCFGERNGKGPGGSEDNGLNGELTASKLNLWLGRTMWGMILRDDLMALDYLASRPEVDAKRIGVTGMSMGSTRSWWLMALDERIKTAVCVACMTRYHNLIAQQNLKAHGIYYFVPNMLKYFDTEAVISLAAPRPVLFMTGDSDPGSPVDGIHVIEEKARKVYQLYGSESDFQSTVYPGLGHAYLLEMWEKMLSWMDQNLKNVQ